MLAISIIISLFKAQIYIRRFAASLQAQTFQNFEIIFTNDLPPDQSAEILREFTTSNPRIKVITRPHNMGAGAARNTEIHAPTGETHCFAAPDDLIPPTSIEIRYTPSKKHNAIVRACHDEIGSNDTIPTRETRPGGMPNICRPSDMTQLFGVSPFLCAHCTKLFPTKKLQHQSIFNEESNRTAEDIIFLICLFFHASKLVWISDIAYLWMKRTDSLSNNFYSNEHYFDYLKCVDLFYDAAKPRKRADLAEAFCNDYQGSYLSHLLLQVAHGKSTKNNAQKVIGEIARVCSRHGVQTRYPPKIQKNILFNSGFFLLWSAISDDSPTMTERLVKDQNTITRLYEKALQLQSA